MQVNITKRIDTPEGKRYCPVVIGPNGRIKPDWVMVNDRQEKHPEGAYYLDWNEDGKRRRMSVGNDAASAYNSRVRKQRELDATAAGLIVSNPIEDDIPRKVVGGWASPQRNRDTTFPRSRSPRPFPSVRSVDARFHSGFGIRKVGLSARATQ
jgi:hypothetical protein